MKLAAIFGAALLALAPTQSKKPEKPEVCPYCKNDPALMAAAGVVSHGPVPIADKTSAELSAHAPGATWIVLETAHLRWASSLGETSVSQKERERVDAELAQLRAVLPAVPDKPRKLDPWLRLHLYAMKGEQLYTRFQAVLQVKDADFPEAPRVEPPYMGIGKFLGEQDKFEVVLHTTRASHTRFTQSFSGVAVTDSFRWHVPKLHKFVVSAPAEDSDLREDRWLWPHVVHNLSHVFLCAYKHFAYDPPPWLDEGLALVLEKEAEPLSHTLEGEEGSYSDTRGPSDFGERARKIAASGKAKTLAQLTAAKSYDELGVDGLVQVWSITRFLLEQHPDKYALFLGRIKGQLDEKGLQTGEDLPGLQRTALKEIWGWSSADLDAAWSAWASAPAPKPGK
jgi:hypothetical protein